MEQTELAKKLLTMAQGYFRGCGVDVKDIMRDGMTVSLQISHDGENVLGHFVPWGNDDKEVLYRFGGMAMQLGKRVFTKGQERE